MEPSLPGLSKDHPAILIMDGHGSHFTFELLKHCRDIGLHILLHPPHTTHILQGEDVVNFAVFKSHHQKAKQVALASKLLHGGVAQLSPADLLLCARDAWQNAFSQRNCLKAWADTGLVPFTRTVYFDLLEEEERKEKHATSLGVDLASNITLHGMLVSSMYPPVCSNPLEAEGPEARCNGAHPGGRCVKKWKPALNSAMLWDKENGVTSDAVFDIVQDTREKRDAQLQAKLAKIAERQRKRTQEARDNNELGSRVWNELISPDCERPIEKLFAPELRACLTFRSVTIPEHARKPTLRELLAAELTRYNEPELSSEEPAQSCGAGESSSAPLLLASEQSRQNQPILDDDSESDSDSSSD